MDPTSHIIDPYLLEKHTEAFVAFVELQSGMPFESFTSNPYTVREEGYKLEVNHVLRYRERGSTSGILAPDLSLMHILCERRPQTTTFDLQREPR